jgi:pectate lyase
MKPQLSILRLALALLASACAGDDDSSPGTEGGGASAGGAIHGPVAGSAGLGAAGDTLGGASAAGASAISGSAGTSAAAGTGAVATAGQTSGGAGTAGGSGAGGSGAGGSGAGGGGAVLGGLIGFATLNGGTTGGKAGQLVNATTFAELKQYAESSDAYVIMISGTISNGAAGGSIKIKSNKSLVGVGDGAFLSGVGLDINNSNNVIVQNLRITLVGVANPAGVNGGDVISISGTSKNIWIDHCELFSEDPSQQTNKDLYDGLLDIKGQTGFITVSWCYLHDHHKGGLVGAADDDLFADRKVTLHHNYYRNVKLRVPMYRGAVGHFMNNYVVGAEDASEIRAGSCVRMEKNYYEKLHYSIYTPSDSKGMTERVDNVEVERAARAYPEDCKADIPYDYAGALTATTNDVKTLVPLQAGVGKL